MSLGSALKNALSALALLALVGAAGVALGSPAPVRFGVGQEPEDRRFDAAAELLEQALMRAGRQGPVARVQGMNQLRSLQALRDGRLDVVMLPSVRAKDVALKPVAFPIRRGLLGVRLLLARPGDAERIARVATLSELRRDFILGYGQAWLDRREIEGLGFRVETANSYRGLFDMLRAGRFDYVSRGVNEVAAELADPRLAGSGLVVVPDIALFYPLDDFFYVRAGAGGLHRDIERGLEALLADGSYDRWLETHYGEAMRAARINERSVLHVLGYPVPEGTPLDRFDILSPVRSQAIFKDLPGE